MSDDYLGFSYLDEMLNQYRFELTAAWHDPSVQLTEDSSWLEFARDITDGILGWAATQGRDVDGDGDVDLRDAANLMRLDSERAAQDNLTNPNIVNWLQGEYGPLSDSVIGTLADMIDHFQPHDDGPPNTGGGGAQTHD